MKKLNAKEIILLELKAKKELRTGELVKKLKLTRQTILQHLQELVNKRKLSKIGTTVNSRYIAYNKFGGKKVTNQKITLIRKINGLNEDRVFNQIDLILQLKKKLSSQAYRILAYSFCEMLNNAIDHSKAKTAIIEFGLKQGSAEFWIKDSGIGAFESIRRSFKLQDHYEAVEHLMKGKQTTAPERHSGQGIFFTSRIADLFIIQSAKLKWLVENKLQEQLKKKTIGTTVFFRVKQKTKKDLGKIFSDYSNNEFEFDKTEVTIRLYRREGQNVSRSEARRILFGLEKFRRITFDFKDVDGIGQAFADEIFRVFQRTQPKIKLEYINANQAVQFMIKRTSID
jgi:anti-sigma regulatory factor (Ser/Thr protein kinase)